MSGFVRKLRRSSRTESWSYYVVCGRAVKTCNCQNTTEFISGEHGRLKTEHNTMPENVRFMDARSFSETDNASPGSGLDSRVD